MHLRFAIFIAFFVLLTGCAASVKKSSSDVALTRIPLESTSRLVLNVSGSQRSTSATDWEGFKLEWKENFLEQARLAGIAFEMQEGPVRPSGQDGTLLFVYVDDYRFLRPGTRYLVGVMSGNAYIESKLTFRNLKTGETFGSQTANTSSSAWEGVFSAMTNKQVEAIASDVFRQMKVVGKARPSS